MKVLDREKVYGCKIVQLSEEEKEEYKKKYSDRNAEILELKMTKSKANHYYGYLWRFIWKGKNNDFCPAYQESRHEFWMKTYTETKEDFKFGDIQEGIRCIREACPRYKIAKEGLCWCNISKDEDNSELVEQWIDEKFDSEKLDYDDYDPEFWSAVSFDNAKSERRLRMRLKIRYGNSYKPPTKNTPVDNKDFDIPIPKEEAMTECQACSKTRRCDFIEYEKLDDWKYICHECEDDLNFKELIKREFKDEM